MRRGAPDGATRLAAPEPRLPPDAAGVRLLRNLGPRSAAMLARAGIGTVGALRALGAAAAWRRVRFMGERPSRNLLWAIAAGLEDRDWRSLTPAEKAALAAQLHDL